MTLRESTHQLEMLLSVNFFGREEELEQLQFEYKKAIKQERSCFINVHGYSGTGKSRLIDTFKHRYVQDFAFFCRGKCETNRSQEPFSVVGDALGELCTVLTEKRENNCDVVQSVLEEIRIALGAEGRFLIPLVPQLSGILNDGRRGVTRTIRSALDHEPAGEERMLFLIRTLFHAITKHFPLVVFFDDLQWVDVSSLEVISWLAMDTRIKRFMIITCYRTNDVVEDHPFAIKLRAISKKRHEPIKTIELLNLSSEEVNALLARTLKLELEDTVDLAGIVFDKTHGNVFFVLQFLQLLQQENLLIYSFLDVRWQWEDVNRIRKLTTISENVVDLVASKLKQLQPHVQNTLIVASCIATAINVTILKQLMKRLRLESVHRIEQTLEEATEQGFLMTTKTGYKFAHDRIQQAAYTLIPAGTGRERLHFEIGCALIDMQSTLHAKDREWLKFTVPDQLQRGKSCITSVTDIVHLATMHLSAGEKAISMAALVPASQYLSNGIEILKGAQLPWENHYELQLALHQKLADVSWKTGSPGKSEQLINQVVLYAKTKQEKTEAYITLAESLGSQAREKEAVDVEVRELKALGVFPPAFRTLKAISVLLEMKKKLRKYSVEEVTNLPLCKDPKIISAFEFLRLLVKHATFVGDDILQVLSGCTMTKLALKHGVHEIAHPCFALVGVFFSTVFGEAREGNRLGQMTVGLMERHGTIDTMGSLTVLSYLQPWCYPLNETLEPLLETYKSGMKQGDVDMALICFTTYLHHGFLSGLSLGPLLEDARSHVETILEYESSGVRAPAECIRQCMLNLAKVCDEPTVLTGEAMDEEEFLASGQSTISLYSFYMFKALLALMYGKIEVAHKMLGRMKKCSKSAIAFCELSPLMFYEALIPLTLAAKTGSALCKRRARKAVNALRKAVSKEDKGMNLSHKLLLLDACFLAISKKKQDDDVIQQAFSRAIQMAARTGFRQDAALANLRAGEYYLSINDDNWSKYYLSRARNLFADWGAYGVADYLSNRHKKYVGSVDTEQRMPSTNHHSRRRHSVAPTRNGDFVTQLTRNGSSDHLPPERSFHQQLSR